MEGEMDAELRFHIDAFAEDLVRGGVPREHGAVLGGVGLNMIIASIQDDGSGGQEPECA